MFKLKIKKSWVSLLPEIQICEQKVMRIQAESESVLQERKRVDRSLRMLRGKLEVLERTRKDADERNQVAHRTNAAMSHEYSASLKVQTRAFKSILKV